MEATVLRLSKTHSVSDSDILLSHARLISSSFLLWLGWSHCRPKLWICCKRQNTYVALKEKRWNLETWISSLLLTFPIILRSSSWSRHLRCVITISSSLHGACLWCLSYILFIYRGSTNGNELCSGVFQLVSQRSCYSSELLSFDIWANYPFLPDILGGRSWSWLDIWDVCLHHAIWLFINCSPDDQGGTFSWSCFLW